jgi:hypothetical protein
VVPVASKKALWTVLQEFFGGRYAKGPKRVCSGFQNRHQDRCRGNSDWQCKKVTGKESSK